jgi:hypothetical protein
MSLAIIYLSFLIFGVNATIVNYLELIFLGFSILGIFLLSYFITKDEYFSLLSSVMYLLAIFIIFYFYGFNDLLYIGICHLFIIFSLFFPVFL